MNEICQLEQVSKSYRLSGRRTLEAVHDVSLTLCEGETLGLVGESGSGKSTLGRQIVALERPTEGKVLYRGRDLADRSWLRQVRH